ncbi:MAG: TrkH family potassium uptake protein [Planctomycetota bacterium]
MNFRAVLWLLSRVVLLIAVVLLLPAAVAFGYGEIDVGEAFVAVALACAAVSGLVGWRCARAIETSEGRPDFFRREGLAAVGLAWLAAGVLGALPYLVTGTIASPVDALFESVSGFTTTGATILPGDVLDALPKGVTFWRCFTNWLGGIGIVLVFVVFFPTGGRSLFRSEVPGLDREAVLQRVRDSAIALVRIYVALTLAEVLALVLAGTSLFDAVLHSFATIATGGFSNYSDSVAHFHSATVELIIVAFMFLSGVNFAIYDTFLRAGRRSGLEMVRTSTELRAYAGLLLVATASMAFVLWFWGGSNGAQATSAEVASLPDYTSLSQCFRDSVFAAVSVNTATGFGTADFHQWPEYCRFALMSLALVGACAGSTGGGLKVVRFIIVWRAALRAVKNFARPRAVTPVRMDGRAVDDSVVAAVTSYFGLWCFALFLGTGVLASSGHDLISSFTGTLVCLNNVGPGLETVGPAANFAHISAIGKLVLSS